MPAEATEREITKETCYVPATHVGRGRRTSVAPGRTASHHLHYGRITLDAGDQALAFENGTHETGLVWAGAGLGAFALAGAVLTLGLVQRWGEVFPRWMIGLAGRRVPIGLATVPATLVAVFVTSASVGFLTADGFLTMFTGGLSLATLPMLLWPLWGVALAAAALAYHLRRRPVCEACGRGGDPVQGVVRARTADAY